MVRLGRISYVNMAPVFYRVDAEVEEVLGVPTELNRMLVAFDKRSASGAPSREAAIIAVTVSIRVLTFFIIDGSRTHRIRYWEPQEGAPAWGEGHLADTR